MKMKSALSFLMLPAVLIGFAAASAQVPEDPKEADNYCAGFHAAVSMSELPVAIRREWKSCAALGKEWNGGDELDDRPSCGMEFAIHHGNRWIVAMGFGGIATSGKYYAYEVSYSGSLAADISDLSSTTRESWEREGLQAFCTKVWAAP
jgi:hypothetical protein